MVARTSTEFAPWHLVPSNDKRWSRIQVLETFADSLADRLHEK
jgi:polyphosphate kinase 2 (PPK2 family)